MQRHKTLAMTLRYSHLLDDRQANTATLLDQPVPGSPEAEREPNALAISHTSEHSPA